MWKWESSFQIFQQVNVLYNIYFIKIFVLSFILWLYIVIITELRLKQFVYTSLESLLRFKKLFLVILFSTLYFSFHSSIHSTSDYFSIAARILSWFACTADALLLLVASRWVAFHPNQHTVCITNTTTPMRKAGLCRKPFVLCLLFSIVRHSKHRYWDTRENTTHGILCIRC